MEAGQTLHPASTIVRRIDLETLPFTEERGWMNLQRKKKQSTFLYWDGNCITNQATCRFFCVFWRISDQSRVKRKRTGEQGFKHPSCNYIHLDVKMMQYSIYCKGFCFQLVSRFEYLQSKIYKRVHMTKTQLMQHCNRHSAKACIK